MDLNRSDATSVHGSSQSSVTNHGIPDGSTTVDWSTLVVEPKEDGDGIPDEMPVDEKAMFDLLGVKTEADERETKPGPILAPIPDYDVHDVKEAAIPVDDSAPEEPFIAWDERKPNMDIGTPYPDMIAFRKAIRQFAINGEFEFGTKKNEPGRFQAFCKGQSIKGSPCNWSLTANWRADIKCDYINNNLAECFNSWVRDYKDLPITQLADKIREKITEVVRKRRILGEKFTGIILPFVIHQLNAKTRGLGHLVAKPSADWTGEVTNKNKDGERHVVKTITKECTCLQWQHTGKPCDHALAFINVLQLRNYVSMEDYVHEYYSVSRFRSTYEGVIEPLTDKTQWPQVDTGFVLRPPLSTGQKKGAGRTRKQRMKSWWEGGSRTGSLNKCKRCEEPGHREAACPKNGTKKRTSSGKRHPSPWFDVSVSNILPSTPTKSTNAATTSSPGPVTRSQAATTPTSPGPFTRSQAAATPTKSAAATPPKSPAKGKKKLTPKKRKMSEL